MPTSRLARRWSAAATALVAVAVLALACTAGGSARTGAGAAGSTPSPIGPPRPIDRPNIVFVLTDDLSTDLVRYMPHVQALAQAGTSFSNYFVVDSLCCPSRASILTGLYPHNTHVFYNAGPHGGWDQFNRVGDARKVFGLTLQAAGYRTGFMGKYLNHYPPTAAPPAGWNEWDVTGSEGYREFDYHLNENGKVHHYGHAAGDYLTTVLSRKAVRFIDTSSAAGKPFALEVATYAPHLPATPAPADRNSFATLHAPRGPQWNRVPRHAPRWLAHYPPLSAGDIAGIDAKYRARVESVQAVDRMVGRLETELARRGLLKSTYFVFSSDNGFHQGQRRMLPGKQTAYDTDIRVPLVVTGPGVPAGCTVTTLASSIDLAPTFEAITGAHSPFPHDGVSLLPLWRGSAAPAGWPDGVLVEHRAANLPGDPDRQGTRSGIGPSYEAVRTAGFLYVEYVTGDREYYDLRTDPNELDNLAGQLAPSRLAQLHQYLSGLSTCGGEDCRSRAQSA